MAHSNKSEDINKLTKVLQDNLNKRSKSVFETFDVISHQGRVAAALLLFVAAFLQIVSPSHLIFGSKLFMPVLEIFLGFSLIILQKILDERHVIFHRITIFLTLLVALGNAFATGLLVDKLINDKSLTATNMLWAASIVWITNVITFSLLFWEFDRGGPTARVINGWKNADFLFPQMDIDYQDSKTKTIANQNWEPHFFDYLYLGVTNATAFSPTDVLPLSWKAKLLMGIQSVVSLGTVTLVAARAVNIL
ncbi:MAG: hypothetical protein U0R17_02090 [Acidimicrobiia bacterium]